MLFKNHSDHSRRIQVIFFVICFVDEKIFYIFEVIIFQIYVKTYFPGISYASDQA